MTVMRFFGWLVLCVALYAQESSKEVTLPDSAEDIARGEKLYRNSCQYCHGPQGDGGKGANLARPKLTRATTDEKLLNFIQNGIPGTEMPGAWHMNDHEATQVAAFVKTLGRVDIKPVPGDPARGKALYAKSGCAGCHTTREDGVITGSLLAPDLSGIGIRRSAVHLREALIDPNASVPEEFVYVTVTLKTGKSVIGHRLSEDTFTILIRDLTGNNHAFQKSAIKEISKDRKKSPMPSYKNKLSAAELDDLIAYLVSLRDAS